MFSHRLASLYLFSHRPASSYMISHRWASSYMFPPKPNLDFTARGFHGFQSIFLTLSIQPTISFLTLCTILPPFYILTILGNFALYKRPFPHTELESNMLQISLLFFPFSHTSPIIQHWYPHRLIVSPELSLVIDVLLDSVDGVFKEPNLMLKLSNLLLDHLI